LLRPGGVLAIATLGPASFGEWRAACAAEHAHAAMPDFPPASVLAQAWPGPAQLDRTALAVAHPSGLAFLRDLRAIGAHTKRHGAPALNPGAMRRVLTRFERDAAATVTYDILFACLRRA
jgi:malonyl-CoA O-methyltransferase